MDVSVLRAITRVLSHREQFTKERFIEERGYETVEDRIMVDGYRDPETGEVLDLETAYAQAQVREIWEKFGEQR